MNEKIIKIIFCVASVLCVATVVVLLLTRSNTPSDDEPIGTLATDAPATLPPSPTPQQSEVHPNPTPSADRTVVLDDKVTVNISGEDYLDEEITDKDSDMDLFDKIYGKAVTDYPFSNGFYLFPTDMVRPADGSTGDMGLLECYDSSFIMSVMELDALSYNLDETLYKIFYTMGFSNYDVLKDVRISRDAKLELGSGLADWKSYFPDYYKDPTISLSNCQLVVNSDEECSYGAVRYICFYTGKDFVAYAFVTCDRDRVLQISVSGDVMSLCWSYIIEATNNCIKLIQ